MIEQLDDLSSSPSRDSDRDRDADELFERFISRDQQNREIWVLPTDTGLVDRIQSEFEKKLVAAGWDSDTALDMAIAFREAFVNAIVHGNVPIHGTHNAEERWQQASAQIRADAALKNKSITVQFGRCDGDEVEVSVTDQGQGFDVTQLQDPTDDDNLMNQSGRGLLVVRNVFDVSWDNGGRTINLLKRRRKNS